MGRWGIEIHEILDDSSVCLQIIDCHIFVVEKSFCPLGNIVPIHTKTVLNLMVSFLKILDQ